MTRSFINKQCVYYTIFTFNITRNKTENISYYSPHNMNITFHCIRIVIYIQQLYFNMAFDSFRNLCDILINSPDKILYIHDLC